MALGAIILFTCVNQKNLSITKIQTWPDLTSWVGTARKPVLEKPAENVLADKSYTAFLKTEHTQWNNEMEKNRNW